MADITIDRNKIDIDERIEIELKNFPLFVGASLLINNVLDVINRYIEPVEIIIEFTYDEDNEEN